jgi:cell wall-associated NlpC family hydrolase
VAVDQSAPGMCVKDGAGVFSASRAVTLGVNPRATGRVPGGKLADSSARRQRFGVLSLTVFSFSVLLAAPSAADPSPGTKKDVRDRTTEVGRISAELALAGGRLDDLNDQAELAVERFNGARARLEQADQDYQAALARAARASERLNQARRDLAVFAANAYRNDNSYPSAAAVLGGRGGPQGFIDRAAIMQVLANRKQFAVDHEKAAHTIADLFERQARQALAAEQRATLDAAAARQAVSAAVAYQQANVEQLGQQQATLTATLDRARAAEAAKAATPRGAAGKAGQAESRSRTAGQAAAPGKVVGRAAPHGATGEAAGRAAAARGKAGQVGARGGVTGKAAAAGKAAEVGRAAPHGAKAGRGTTASGRAGQAGSRSGIAGREEEDPDKASDGAAPRGAAGQAADKVAQVAHGLPRGSAHGAVAARAALKWIGTPYSWGGGNQAGPSLGIAQGAHTVGFDCSGLVTYAWARAGVRLTHYATAQYNSGPHPPRNELRPGDLVFFAHDPANPATIHHVGIYIGHGQMVEAPFTGARVRISNAFRPDYAGATRPAALR